MMRYTSDLQRGRGSGNLAPVDIYNFVKNSVVNY